MTDTIDPSSSTKVTCIADSYVVAPQLGHLATETYETEVAATAAARLMATRYACKVKVLRVTEVLSISAVEK